MTRIPAHRSQTMSQYLKDDLTVALDDVDRIASRIVTIHRDLAAVAGDQATAATLLDRAEQRERALHAFNAARRAHAQLPETEEPERAHLEALWLKLKAAVAWGRSAHALERSLAELDQRLCQAVAEACALEPPTDVERALQALCPDQVA
jgi:small-conductance mechanosensitive channel